MAGQCCGRSPVRYDSLYPTQLGFSIQEELRFRRRFLAGRCRGRSPIRYDFLYPTSWDSIFREEELRFRRRSWQVDVPRQSSNKIRFSLSHFPSRRTSWKPIGPPVVPGPFCGNARFVSTIRSSAMDAAASRHTTSITTGLRSAVAAAPIAGRLSPSCRGFRSLTPITACSPVARHCGGALWSTTPGNRPRLRSKTQTAYPILPRSAVGRVAWTVPNRGFLFSARRSPASLTG